VDQAIAANAQASADVRAGKMAAIGRIVGAVMKLAGGKADAKTVNERILARLKEGA
jgi:Asp-tRNA(Asn)/Glu-tRNA(Gln) amidotransferase B subunit